MLIILTTFSDLLTFEIIGIILVIYYLVIIPYFFRNECLLMLSKLKAKDSTFQNLSDVFQEYREWLILIQSLQPDQKQKAIYALENKQWLSKEPYKSFCDLESIWRDKLNDHKIQQIKNQNQ